MTIGEKIRQIRTSVKYPTKTLSAKVGKSTAYVSQLERGLIKKPDKNTIILILKELGLTSSEIESFLEEEQCYKEVEKVESKKIELNITSDEELDLLFKQDAVSIYNSIRTLPTKTKMYLKEMLEMTCE